mmetsp:Transcript_6826/g.17369  ORF Transcript_6826/g.17369 Transcript_6826/m.17369 type:complete len:89 (+) Transcript_6826:1-267(+)
MTDRCLEGEGEGEAEAEAKPAPDLDPGLVPWARPDPGPNPDPGLVASSPSAAAALFGDLVGDSLRESGEAGPPPDPDADIDTEPWWVV